MISDERAIHITDRFLNLLNFFLNKPQLFILSGLLMQERFPTCPVEVKARDDWLPAQTFLMNIPCRASTTFGL